MKSSRRCLVGLCGLAVLFLAACAPTLEKASTAESTASESAAIEVFAAGYVGVAEKYIDSVRVSDLAIEGLRGLGGLDPALTVDRTGDQVTLASAGRELVRRAAPEPGDAKGWARLTVDFSTAARTASRELREADMEAVYEAVFDGVLSNLDIFSRYAGAEEARRNRAKRDGFGGIGIRYRVEDGLPVLTQVMAETPAAEGGLRPGDRITHVDGQSLQGLSRAEIGGRLRGPTYTEVILTVTRPGTEGTLRIALERAHIFAPTVFETRKDGIVIIRLKSFNQDTARAMAETLERARNQLGDAMKGVVLDLRGNPGGLLKQSVKVADLLLTQGKIVATRGRHVDSIHSYEAGGRDLALGLPVVVLVDGKSASAAEIVAAALQDRDRAVVIGTASFGKGSVQTVIRLPNEGEITLTWSRLVAPSGYLLHGLGVLPAICTSGVSGGGEAVVRAAMEDRTKGETALDAWRKPGMRDAESRRRLRETCPAERRRDPIEVEVARRILGDPTLYARALAVSGGTHEARY